MPRLPLPRLSPTTAGLLALGLLAGLSSLFAYRYEPWWPTRTEVQRHDPDYWFEGFSAVRMNLEGVPIQRLTGKRLQHYPDDDSTELETARLVHYPQQGAPWVVTAERARVTEDGALVFLPGQVLAEQAPSAADPGLTLRTHDLRVLVEQEYLETDREVSITRGGDMINATGMRAFLREERLLLQSKVKATHEPNRR